MSSVRWLGVLAAAGAIVIGVTGSAAGESAPGAGATGQTAARWTTLGAFRTPSAARVLPAQLLRSFAAPYFEIPAGIPVGSLHGYEFYLVPGKQNRVCVVGLGSAAQEAKDYGVCGRIGDLVHGVIWVGRPVGRSTDVVGIVPDGYVSVKAGGRAAPVRNNVFMMRTGPKARRLTASGNGLSSRSIPIESGAPTGPR
jgi:hypothetical protein